MVLESTIEEEKRMNTLESSEIDKLELIRETEHRALTVIISVLQQMVKRSVVFVGEGTILLESQIEFAEVCVSENSLFVIEGNGKRNQVPEKANRNQ